MSECEILNLKILKNGLKKDYLANYLNITDRYFTMFLSGKKRLSPNKLNKLVKILSIYDQTKNKLKYVV